MKLSWDEAKRQATRDERGLDFALAAELLSGDQYQYEDRRMDYGEPRFVSVGFIAGRMCVVVWTSRGDRHHIISLRKANDREKARYQIQIGSQ